MMRICRSVFVALLSIGIVGVTGCATNQAQIDYAGYRSHMPRSILVLPPTNDSIEVDASYVYLSTITRPLAEAGYYVFPVAVVDNYMKENGLPTPNEMSSVPLDKLRKVFGTDAVLYIHIEDWGQKFQLISSSTVVRARAKLVDARTGSVLWEGVARAVQSSGDGGGGLLGKMVAAVVEQVVHANSGRVRQLSGVANHSMILNTQNGMLLGPYNTDYATDVRGR